MDRRAWQAIVHGITKRWTWLTTQIQAVCLQFRYLPIFGLHCGSAPKESTCNEGDLGSILGLGRYPGEGKGYPLQYSGLENFKDCIVHGVAKGRMWLRDFHFHLYEVYKVVKFKSRVVVTRGWGKRKKRNCCLMGIPPNTSILPMTKLRLKS